MCINACLRFFFQLIQVTTQFFTLWVLVLILLYLVDHICHRKIITPNIRLNIYTLSFKNWSRLIRFIIKINHTFKLIFSNSSKTFMQILQWSYSQTIQLAEEPEFWSQIVYIKFLFQLCYCFLLEIFYTSNLKTDL